jgi:GNAT superfamily N-acetyltransferase
VPVIRDPADEVLQAAARRWRGLDPMLPDQARLPEGCMPPLAAGPLPQPADRAPPVRPEVRGTGVGAALVRRAHAEIDARGVRTTLLHYAQTNPASAPFWSRMGYRPLWTGWQARPAASLR